MEAVGVLDLENEIDFFALRCLYLPLINHSLEEFSRAWNKHPLQTEHNWSPHKIWTNSVICGEIDNHVPEVDSFGVDDKGPIVNEQVNTVIVPEKMEDLAEEATEIFLQRLNNLTSNIGDVDTNVEFLEANSTFLELLESSSDSDSD